MQNKSKRKWFIVYFFYIYYFTCLVFLQVTDHVLILDVLKLMLFGWCNLKKYLMHMVNASNNVSILAINFSKTSLIFFGKKKFILFYWVNFYKFSILYYRVIFILWTWWWTRWRTRWWWWWWWWWCCWL